MTLGYWIVAAAGLWALAVFLCFDLPILTGQTIADGPDPNRPGHLIGIGVRPLDLLLHLALLTLWALTYRWWREGRETS